MPRQAEFAGFSVGLEPLPDETLFSWCSRYHRLAANGHDRTTCLQLFGHYRTGTAHDFPSLLGALATRTGGTLGPAAGIIRRRTLLPFYLPFRSRALGQQAEQAMCGQGIGHLKYRLGLLTSGLGAAHPLKACHLCISDDLGQHGWAYWRRSHQLPGVWLCPRHQVSLQVSSRKLDQVARFSWVLPMQASCAAVACLEGLETASEQTVWLFKLGALCMALLDYPPASFDDPVRISLTIRSRLKTLGMTHSAGRIRWSMVESALKQMTMNMACLPEFNHQSDPVLLRSQLMRLLSGRALTHPLRYLCWVATWFDDLDDFQKVYDGVTGSVHRTADKTVTVRHWPNEQQQEALLQATEGRISLTAAARQAGVCYATMAAWVCRRAAEPSRRPKKLDSSLWEQMVIQLRNGADKEAVALAFDVSIVTVTRVLRTVPGLQNQWHLVRHEQRRFTVRHAWEEIVGLHAYMGLKSLRRLQPAAYAWLYRNDRDWLNASVGTIPRRSTANHAARRIENADARMAAALKKATNRNSNIQAWTLDALKRSFPRIKKAIHSPECWPQTIKALAFILAFAPSHGACS